MLVALSHAEQLSDTIRSYYFRPEKPLRYDPGQFVALPLELPDGTRESKWFTLASSPLDELLCVTTRHSPHDSPYKRQLQSFRRGAELHITELLGDFVLPMDKRRPLVFVAAGIGITPFRSMLRWMAQTGEQRDIRLLYSSGTPEDLVYRDELEGYLFDRVYITCTRPPASWRGNTGPITPQLIVEAAAADALIYIAGPDGVVSGLTDALPKYGIPADRIVTDYFTGYEQDTGYDQEDASDDITGDSQAVR